MNTELYEMTKFVSQYVAFIFPLLIIGILYLLNRGNATEYLKRIGTYFYTTIFIIGESFILFVLFIF